MSIEHNFKYHPPDENTAQVHAALREKAKEFAVLVDQLPVSAGREKAVAITKIEEAMMWACAGICRHPFATGGTVPGKGPLVGES